MSARFWRYLWGAVLFTMFGLCTEIVFTGILSWWGGSFRGQVSLLMIPVYASAYVFARPLQRRMDEAGWSSPRVQVPLAVLLVYTLEWSFGETYAAFGLWPWRYEHGWASDFSNGHITLFYLPAWTFFGFVVMRVLRVVGHAAPHLDAAARAASVSPAAPAPRRSAPPS
jgi:hypothetical protein